MRIGRRKALKWGAAFLAVGFSRLAQAENPSLPEVIRPPGGRAALRKGMCYGNDAFPKPYDPSTANDTEVFFGSDNAANYIEPLWGKQFRPKPDPGASGGCGIGDFIPCRNDLQTMKAMGVEVIKLYDWEPRNLHGGFLDECENLGIAVLFSVADYFVKPGQGLPHKGELIPKLISSISVKNAFGSDYHPAIVGIAIGNEFAGFSEENLAEFTNAWPSHESSQHRKLPIGHPLAFGAENGKLPCWSRWDKLLPLLNDRVKSRLFLAPNCYNDAHYLFRDVGGPPPNAGKGWVDLTFDKYRLPIWFTEIGQDRTKPNFAAIVRGQLRECLSYSRANPHKLIGACFFQFADKVWLPEGKSEASFGAHSHAACSRSSQQCTIDYSPKDFTHWEKPAGKLVLDALQRTALYDVVKDVYTTEL